MKRYMINEFAFTFCCPSIVFRHLSITRKKAKIDIGNTLSLPLHSLDCLLTVTFLRRRFCRPSLRLLSHCFETVDRIDS